MSEIAWEVKQGHIDMATQGVITQAKRFDLDLSDPRVAGFVQHQIEVIAGMLALSSFQQSTIHRMSGMGDGS